MAAILHDVQREEIQGVQEQLRMDMASHREFVEQKQASTAAATAAAATTNTTNSCRGEKRKS